MEENEKMEKATYYREDGSTFEFVEHDIFKDLQKNLGYHNRTKFMQLVETDKVIQYALNKRFEEKNISEKRVKTFYSSLHNTLNRPHHASLRALIYDAFKRKAEEMEKEKPLTPNQYIKESHGMIKQLLQRVEKLESDIETMKNR
jgi:hypothetical protein